MHKISCQSIKYLSRYLIKCQKISTYLCCRRGRQRKQMKDVDSQRFIDMFNMNNL